MNLSAGTFYSAREKLGHSAFVGLVSMRTRPAFVGGEKGSRRVAESTLARLKSLQNMSASEIRAFLDSDEFTEHGGKATERNGRRIAGLMQKKGDAHTAEDTAVIRQAIAAIERCRNSHGGHDGNQNLHELTAAKAVGYDHEKAKAEEPGPDKPAPSAADDTSADDTGAEGPAPDEE